MDINFSYMAYINIFYLRIMIGIVINENVDYLGWSLTQNYLFMVNMSIPISIHGTIV